MQEPVGHFDVVILGGAFSGASAALLLRRECPGLSVLVVERLAKFDEKVGEATTEMSAMFLTRRLALWEHLEREHLPKEGLRYWSANEKVSGHADASETGGFLRSAVCAFQLRRDVLDEHVLGLAAAKGATLWRPARVRDVVLNEGGGAAARVVVEREGVAVAVTCTLGPGRHGPAHVPGQAAGADRLDRRTPDGRRLGAVARRAPHRRPRRPRAAGPVPRERRLPPARDQPLRRPRAIWVWVIPLGNGETSIGVVFDKRLHRLHESRDREADYVAFLESHPALRELLEGAQRPQRRPPLAVSHGLRQPAVRRRRLGSAGRRRGVHRPVLLAGPGPRRLYRGRHRGADPSRHEGKDITRAIATHNDLFLRSYRRFFRAAYLDKYLYMGEHDLLSAAFLIDTALYYMFLVVPSYRFAGRFRPEPVLGPRAGYPSYLFMRWMGRRFVALAALRRSTGEAGRRNDGRRIKAYYNLQFAPPPHARARRQAVASGGVGRCPAAG